MKAKELEAYKKTLIEMQNRTRDEINRMIEVVRTGARDPGEHDRGTSESVAKEIELEHAEETIRTAIAQALARIDAGTYGQCEDCEQPIVTARLQAIPYTACCVECEQKRASRPS